MRRFERSGESVARFCEQEGVSAPSFYQWRKKLAEPSAAGGASLPVAAGFAAVRVVASPAVTVRLPGGTEIDLPTADRELLELALESITQADARRVAGGEPC